MIEKDNFFIITGGPGTGKTTLLNELKERMFNIVPEVARDIIKHQIKTGGNVLPWGNTKKYSAKMLCGSVDDFIRLSGSDEVYLFDRGIPDTYGYEILMNFDLDPVLIEAMKNYRYNNNVFILSPWEEIYHTDNERKQDFKTAIETYDALRKAYENFNYNLIEVPCISVEKRADFIIDSIDKLIVNE